MILKWLKRGVIVAGGVALVGVLVFGTDVVSYLRSGARQTRAAIKDSIPMEFELQRARDLLEEIIPEMHANVRLIAEEEVEIAALKGDIPKSQERLAWQRDKIEKLSGMLSVQRVSYEVGGQDFARQEIKDELARRFGRFKESELVLAGKRRLLKAREKSLQAAIQVLDRTKAQKALLADKIASLEAQHRLVQAASVGSKLQLDNTKLAQAQRLIDQIKKRLDVAERVLAHEARFTESIPTDTVSEEELLAQVHEHLAGGSDRIAVASVSDETKSSKLTEGE
jgi:hypothetical protein